MKKIIGNRKPRTYTVLNRLPKPPYKEILIVRDLTGKR
jgi:hypothetical protein